MDRYREYVIPGRRGLDIVLPKISTQSQRPLTLSEEKRGT